MYVSATAPRRKPATYGKASRKPMVTAGNAFATAAESDIWNVQSSLVDFRKNAISASKQIVSAAANDAGRQSSARSAVYRVRNLKLNEQNRPLGSPTTTVAGSDSMYDIPSSDDDLLRNPIATLAGPRKRRRISPQLVPESDTLVYDDASLQKHIAAEFQKDLSHRPSYSAKRVLDNKAHPARSLKENGIKRKSSTPDKLLKTSKARVDCRPGDDVGRPGLVDAEHGSGQESRAHPIAERRARRCLTTESPPKGTKEALNNITKDVAAPTTPEARSATPQWQAHPSTTSLSPSGESSYPPCTPPRHPKPNHGTTTPRQRTLWNELLTENTPVASPSVLDLPSLTLIQKESNKGDKLVTARRTTGENNQDLDFKSRPRKIVDTLHLNKHDRRYMDDYHSQDSDSVCSDSLSESTESVASALKGEITVQTSQSLNSHNIAEKYHVPALSSTCQPPPALHGTGLKVTYARQRSYLTDSDLDEVAMLRMPFVPEPVSSQRVSCKGLGSRLPQSESIRCVENEAGASQDSQGGAMRSIHELREAGGNVRLVGELEAILDDIEQEQPASRTLRRSSLLDLVAKLQEHSNCRLFIDQGLESRLLAYVGTETDIITSSLLAVAILQLIASRTSTLILSQLNSSHVVDFLIDLLELDQDLASQAKLRENNLSRYAQQEYKKVCTSVLKLAAWRAGKPSVLSCRVLALQCLEYLVRQTRESGFSSVILSAYAIRRIVALSIPPASIPLPQLTPTSALRLELAVSILESCTISSAAECQEPLWEGETLQRVTSLLPLLFSWKEPECATARDLTLRLYCNLTNNNPGLCEEFSTPDNVEALFKMIIAKFKQLSEKSTQQQHSTVSDNLILSLGAFVNLAESSSVVRRMVLNLHHGQQTFLEILLELFMTKSMNAAEVFSEEETCLNVAVGYLSVLLGFLCLDRNVKAWVSARLRGGTTAQLIDALEEFLRYYKQVGQEVYQGEAEGDSKASYVGRLQGLVEDLKD